MLVVLAVLVMLAVLAELVLLGGGLLATPWTVPRAQDLSGQPCRAGRAGRTVTRCILMAVSGRGGLLMREEEPAATSGCQRPAIKVVDPGRAGQGPPPGCRLAAAKGQARPWQDDPGPRRSAVWRPRGSAFSPAPA